MAANNQSTTDTLQLITRVTGRGRGNFTGAKGRALISFAETSVKQTLFPFCKHKNAQQFCSCSLKENMHIHIFLFCVVFSFTGTVFSDEDYVQLAACCTFRGPHMEDIEYIIRGRLNKMLLMFYNSTTSKWTGFSPYSIEMANAWNNDPYDKIQRTFEKNTLCIQNLGLIQQQVNLTAAPTIKLNSVKRSSLLVCSAYNFYPKQIQITWLRNGQEMTSAVSVTDAMPDGEWYYQIHSYLEHIPTAGENITCMVKHVSLPEPVFQAWDPSLPEPERGRIFVGLCGLILGLVFVTSGFIYYKRKAAAYSTLYRGRVSVPVEYRREAEAI